MSDTARLYDPLGFIAPILVNTKIFLHDLWINKLEWDKPLPDDLPEWHLHGFADGSKRAYAAVVYVVIPRTSSRILMAKTRVAPVKLVSIPRLELCGAALLVRLAKYLVGDLLHLSASMNFWSDSKVVLDWLRSDPSRYPTSVANCVSEIASTFPDAAWRHVPSMDNPADCTSHGTTAQDLARQDLWWEGPKWLPQPETKWPPQSAPVIEQLSALAAVEKATVEIPEEDLLLHLQGFSSFSQIIRVFTYCLRWKHFCFRKELVAAAGPTHSGLRVQKNARNA